MAFDNVLLFVAFTFALVCQCSCSLKFCTEIMANLTQRTVAIVSDECVLDLKDMSVDCSQHGLLEVPQDFRPNIKKLNLAYNYRLNNLRNISFVRYPLLEFLDLESCQLTHIERGTFYPLKKLKELVLTDRGVISYPMDGELFRHSVNLQYLNIGSNLFRAIPSAILHIPRLKSLWIYDNCLSFVNITCGENIMDSIDLSVNIIRRILPENFVFDCPTTFLSLDYNPIEMIDPDVIASIPVKSLSLSHQNMSFEVLRSLFVGISRSTTIQEVYLTNIHLDHRIPPDLFDPLCNKSLTALDLRGNYFVLEAHIFSSLTYVSCTVPLKGLLGYY